MPLLPPLGPHNGLYAMKSPYAVPPHGNPWPWHSQYAPLFSPLMLGDSFGDQGGIRGSEPDLGSRAPWTLSSSM